MSDNIGCVGCDIKHCPFTLSYRKPVYRGYVVYMIIRGNFTLPVRDPPYLIITGNCQGNMKLNLKSYKWGQAPNRQK